MSPFAAATPSKYVSPFVAHPPVFTPPPPTQAEIERAREADKFARLTSRLIRLCRETRAARWWVPANVPSTHRVTLFRPKWCQTRRV